MPTSPRSTTLPVRRETKARLQAVKRDEEFDALLRGLLGIVPPERLRERLDFDRREQVNLARARTLEPKRRELKRERSPEKQVMIARAAAAARGQWERDGRLVRLPEGRLRWDREKFDEAAWGGGLGVRRR